jgi:hypothetical protein
MTITIPAPIHNAGITDESEAEFGRKTNAIEERNAPVRK